MGKIKFGVVGLIRGSVFVIKIKLTSPNSFALLYS